MTSVRGSGRTTRQLRHAKPNAVFVWVHHHLDYPKSLAASLQRHDIRIVGPQWLQDGWRGMRYSEVILDHALLLTDSQWEAYCACRDYLAAHAGAGKA